jgi:hypothetical protein
MSPLWGFMDACGIFTGPWRRCYTQLSSQRDVLKIAQQFIAGKHWQIHRLSLVGTAEASRKPSIVPTGRAVVSRLVPSDEQDYASASNTKSSRNAATVNSQGRQPLERVHRFEFEAPTGRQTVSHLLSPRWGFNDLALLSQGLTPLAINFRPFGPTCTCIIL